MLFRFLNFLLLQFFIYFSCAAIGPASGNNGLNSKAFTNKSFQNTKDFAGSGLGPTISAKKANPQLYKNNATQSAGPPPPPPPEGVPLDGGLLVILGGSMISGLSYFLRRFKNIN